MDSFFAITKTTLIIALSITLAKSDFKGMQSFHNVLCITKRRGVVFRSRGSNPFMFLNHPIFESHCSVLIFILNL